MNLDVFLMALRMIASLAASLPGKIGVESAFAAKLVEIAAAAANAHKELTGQPIDLQKLHEV